VNRCALGFALILFAFPLVQAHQVTIDWSVADGVLQLEGKIGSANAVGATVEIRSNRGRLIESGAMDESGRFRWPITDRGPVTVTLTDQFGHRGRLALTDAELRAVTGTGTGHGPIALPLAMRVLLGLTCLLALAAAWMSHRNTRRLDALERHIRQHESGS
jgi:hypothetical protein